MTKIMRYLFGKEAAKDITTRTMEGQSWYMAANICGLLGIANHSQAVHHERDDGLQPLESEWRKETIYIGGSSKKHILLVNNGGALKLIYQATTPFARKVQEKVNKTPEELRPAQWADYRVKEE